MDKIEEAVICEEVSLGVVVPVAEIFKPSSSAISVINPDDMNRLRIRTMYDHRKHQKRRMLPGTRPKKM